VDNFYPEVQDWKHRKLLRAQPGLNSSVRISQNLAVYIGFREFESYASQELPGSRWTCVTLQSK